MDALSKPDREELELRAFRASKLVAQLRELETTEGWAALRDVFAAMEETYYRELSRQLMRGREINQRKLDYNRGLFDGVRQLLAQPDRARAMLDKVTQKLETEQADEKE